MLSKGLIFVHGKLRKFFFKKKLELEEKVLKKEKKREGLPIFALLLEFEGKPFLIK